MHRYHFWSGDERAEQEKREQGGRERPVRLYVVGSVLKTLKIPNNSTMYTDNDEILQQDPFIISYDE